MPIPGSFANQAVELRTAMMIPVIYEQLKRKKLKIHKARCVRDYVLSGAKGGRRKAP